MLQKHRLRVSSDEYRENQKSALIQWYDKAVEQFSQNRDLNRCYLNISGTEAELGRLNSAFRYLYMAATLCAGSNYPQIIDDDQIDEARCCAIVQICNCVNSKDDQKS